MSDEQTGRWLRVVAALGTTQTLAWASSYYLIAILADPIARDLGTSSSWVFGAFSASLLIAAVIGPRVGRSIDALGGRGILAASNLVFAAGLLALALAQGQPMLWLGWGLMGLGMGLGLYDAAFAALGRIYGTDARRSITGITLIAGFASTVGWPLTAWGLSLVGWRYTCVGWALAHLLIGLPLNLLMLPRIVQVSSASAHDSVKPHVPMDRAMWLLGIAFAAGWLVSTAMAAHLPRILQAAGATPAEAIFAGMLIGPAQVIARILEAGLLSRFHPLLSARLCTLMHPIGVALLFAGGGVMASAFAFMHGAGNGVLTIARGTVPLAVYGRENYGYRLGLLGAPARIAQAGAPLAFGILLERFDSQVLYLSTALCLGAFLALICVRPLTTTKPA